MELSPQFYRMFVRPPIFTKYYIHYRIKPLLKTFDFTNKQVLDFGCGIGSNSVLFHPEYYIGMDCDKKRIDYAKTRYKHHRFIAQEDSILDLDDHCVDYIMIFAVIHHIPTREVHKYIEEFKRVLNPSGKIFILEPCFLTSTKFRNAFMDFMDKGAYIRKDSEYIKLFQKGGFQTDQPQYFHKCFLYNELFFTATPKEV